MCPTPIVFDIGEFSSKIGFSSENDPRYVFYTIVGTPKYQDLQMNYTNNSKAYYVGNEVANSMGLYKIYKPIILGKIDDWVLFEQILDYAFYLLKVDPTLVNVLYTYHPYFSSDDRNKLMELFFDKYQVAGFYPVLDSLLTMYSGGFQTGLCVEMGASSIRIVPIFESYKIEHAIQVIEIGGTTIDSFMLKVLKGAGYSANSSVQKELVRVLKERACFVSLEYENDMKNKNKYKKEYSLPDGNVIELSYERFYVPELLFKPSLFNIEQKSLPEAIIDSIEQCDIDIRSKLLHNIFISGGSSNFPQLEYRLKDELELELVKRGYEKRNVRIIAPKGREFSCWIGGSILGYIPEFQSSWITRAQYYRGEFPEDL